MGDSAASKIEDWFRLEDYACVANFGPAEWCLSLAVRIDHDKGKRELELIDVNKFWREYLDKTRPSKVQELTHDEDHNWPFSAFEALEEIPVNKFASEELRNNLPGAEFTGDLKTIAYIRDEMIWFGKRLLLIDPETPDPVLHEKFETWLKKVRDQHPLPMRRRGPKSANQIITEAHLKSWANYMVLACFDIDYWAHVFQKPQVSYEWLCKHTFDRHYRGNAKEWGRTARKKVTEAVDCFHALSLQISQPT